MAENNLEENIEIKENTAPVTDGKKKHMGYFFIAFIPFAIMMALQTAAMIPGMILTVAELSKSGQNYDVTFLMKTFNEKYAIYCYMAYCVAAITIFLIWYLKSFVKKGPKISYKKALGVKPVILTLAIMLCLYFTVNGAFIAANKLFPEVMKKYAELMELSSLGSNMWITVLYGILLGPVAEELCYRGLVFGYLEKSNVSIRIVIVVQAALFGIMHANLVQGLYAFALGVLFGYLRYKYKTLLLMIGAHMLFNFSGTIVAVKMENSGLTDTMNMVLGAVAAILVAVFIILIAKDKRSCYVQEETI